MSLFVGIDVSSSDFKVRIIDERGNEGNIVRVRCLVIGAPDGVATTGIKVISFLPNVTS